MREASASNLPPTSLGPEGGPFEGFEPRHEIGRGNYGSVWLLQHPDGRKCVDKRIRLKNLSEKEKTLALAEIELLRKLQHTNVVRYRHSFTRHNKLLHILMDYCDGGTLGDALAKAKARQPPQPVDAVDVRRWMHQSMSALAHLHQNRVIHRDVKPANIFLVRRAGSTEAVLGDFGISRALSPDTVFAMTNMGTPNYMSPEAMAGVGYDGRADVWSMGCILFELLALHLPFPAGSIGQLALAVSSHAPDGLPASAPEDAAKVVELCLIKNPEARPTAAALLESSPLSSWANGAAPSAPEDAAKVVELCLIKNPEARPTAAALLESSPLSSWANGAASPSPVEVQTGWHSLGPALPNTLPADTLPAGLSFAKTVRVPSMIMAEVTQARREEAKTKAEHEAAGKEVYEETRPPFELPVAALEDVLRPHAITICDEDEAESDWRDNDSPFVRFRPTPAF